MANSEVLEGGLLCGLRNDLGEQEVAAWQNWQFDKYGDRKLRRGFAGGQLLFTLPSLAGVFKRVKLAGRRHLHVPHDVVHSAVNLHAQFYRADEFMIGESDLYPRPAICDVVRPRPVYISTLRRVPHVKNVLGIRLQKSKPKGTNSPISFISSFFFKQTKMRRKIVL